MKLHNLRIERQPKFMIIPMIDIIFFLLVFFMMSSLSMTQQRVIPVSLPRAGTAQADAGRPVNVTLALDGFLYIDQDKVSAEQFGQTIRGLLAGKPDTPVILRADQQVFYGKVVWLLDECRKAGVRRVSVAAETGESG